jgi:hypothetical protein
MKKIITKEKFEALCAAESYIFSALSEEEGIGIYNEKRLHKILKRSICESESCFEVKVGRYTADILTDGRIYEIQCASLYPLKDKIAYYLDSTDYKVTVVHPLIVKKTLIRAEKETGEILRMKKSPKKESVESLLPDLIYIARAFENEHFSLCLVSIEAEEYRYSEAVRYRRSGKYDSELFPCVLVGIEEFSSPRDFERFIPNEIRGREFSPTEYAPYTSLKGRDAYSALKFLAEIGLLKRRKDGRRVLYSTVD